MLIKVKVIKTFRDAKNGYIEYKVGDIIEVDEKRYEKLAGKNKYNESYVEKVSTEKKEKVGK